MPEADVAPTPDIAAPSEDRGNVPGAPVGTEQESAFGDAFADLDKAFNEPAAPAKEAPKEAPKDADKARGPDGKFLPADKQPKKDEPPKGKPDAKGDEKKEAPVGDAKKESESKKEEDLDKMSPKELRDFAKRVRQKHRELEQEHTKLKSAPAQPQEDPEKKTLTERLTAREKRLQEVEDELRFTAYERSQEYKEKFEQPFVSAWQTGQARASRLNVVEEKNEIGEVIQATRKGTQEDFDTLMRIQDDGEAASWAAKFFGPQAQMLLYHREKVQEANQARVNALAEFKKNGGEREAQRKSLIENHQKAVRSLFEATKKAGLDKYPQFFQAPEDDPKAKTLLEKGMRLADRAFGAPDEEGEKPLGPEDRIRLQAAMRNSFGAFQRVAYELHKERQARKDLEAKISEFEASDPNKAGDGKGRGGGRAETATDAETPEGAFDATFGPA